MIIRPQVQVVNDGTLYANGCIVDAVSDNIITVSPGQLRDFTNTFDMVLTDPLTIDTTKNGVGGLDQGTVQPNTFYAVYVIFDASRTNNTNVMMSAVGYNPLMPSIDLQTFGYYRVVGYVRTDDTAKLLKATIFGSGTTRENIWSLAPQVLSAGSSSPNYSNLSLSLGVPQIMWQSNPDLPAPLNPSSRVSLNCYFATSNPTQSSLFILDGGGGSPTRGATVTILSSGTVSVSAQCSVAADFLPVTGPVGDYIIRYKNLYPADEVTIEISSFSYNI